LFAYVMFWFISKFALSTNLKPYTMLKMYTKDRKWILLDALKIISSMFNDVN